MLPVGPPTPHPLLEAYTLGYVVSHCAVVLMQEDMGFIFEKGIGLKDFFTSNITEYCTEYMCVRVFGEQSRT